MAITRLGGTASRRQLLRLTSKRRLRTALKAGTIVRVARGRFALPHVEAASREAARISGVICMRSAAIAHGWEVKQLPDRPEVAVSPRRNLPAARREGVRVRWMNVAADDVHDGVTTPLKTVVDSARHLPFDEALAIADSALRSGMVTVDDLASVQVRGAGAAAVRRVLRHADARAANPFESVLRALCIEAGLDVEPQGEIDLGSGTVHPDVVCRSRWLAIEADSWAFHTSRKAHRKDCARYNLLIVRGWLVLRFTWEQEMHDQAYVRWVLAELQGRVEKDELRGDLARSA